MFRDEMANPGLTVLSQFARSSLESLENEANPVMHFDIPVEGATATLTFDFSAVPPSTLPGSATLEEMIVEANARFLATPVILRHGESDNPFIQYEDTLMPDGSVIIDSSGVVDIELLTGFYYGAKYTVSEGEDITAVSVVLTSKTILANMLTSVIEYGVATESEVQNLFGTAYPDVVAQVVDNVLPPLVALNDPLADVAFKAYLAYFGRPPDPGGLTSWVEKLKMPGYSMDSMIEDFGNSKESISLYGSTSSGDKVDSIFHYLFNRGPAEEGRKFWVGAIDSGSLSMAGAALHILNGARDDATQGTSDLTLVNEKIAAAKIFVDNIDTQRELELYVGATAALSARKYLSAITADDAVNANVTHIVGSVINYLQDNVGGGIDHLFATNDITLGYY